MIDAARYLLRLQWGVPFDGSVEAIARLHERHRMLVPRENLHLLAGEPVTLDEDALAERIVGRRRGGCGLELNLAFAGLLRALGLPVRVLGARRMRADDEALTTMPLLVELDPPLLVDVGSEAGFPHPLPLVAGIERRMLGESWRLEVADEEWVLARFDRARLAWSRLRRFQLTAREPADFAEACAALEHGAREPDAAPAVTAATPDGRIVWDGAVLRIERRGRTEEQPIDGEEAIARMLERRFGIVL